MDRRSSQMLRHLAIETACDVCMQYANAGRQAQELVQAPWLQPCCFGVVHYSSCCPKLVPHLGGVQRHAQSARPVQVVSHCAGRRRHLCNSATYQSTGGGIGRCPFKNRRQRLHQAAAAKSRSILLLLSFFIRQDVSEPTLRSTSCSEPRAQNSVTRHGGSRHTPMNSTMLGCRIDARMLTCGSNGTDQLSVVQLFAGCWGAGTTPGS